jgi:hypothetical protein
MGGIHRIHQHFANLFREIVLFRRLYRLRRCLPLSIPLYRSLHLTHLHLDAPWRVVREVRRLLAMATLDNIPDTSVLEAKLELESLATILQLDSPTRVHPLIDQATEFKQNLTADSSIYTISFSTTNQSDVDSAYTEYEPRKDTESLPMGIRWGLAEIILEDDVPIDSRQGCMVTESLPMGVRWGLAKIILEDDVPMDVI